MLFQLISHGIIGAFMVQTLLLSCCMFCENWVKTATKFPFFAVILLWIQFVFIWWCVFQSFIVLILSTLYDLCFVLNAFFLLVIGKSFLLKYLFITSFCDHWSKIHSVNYFSNVCHFGQQLPLKNFRTSYNLNKEFNIKNS